MENANPFLSLFGASTPESLSKVREQVREQLGDTKEPEPTDAYTKLSEDVFLFTVEKSKTTLLYLEDFASCLPPGQKMNRDVLEQALFERLIFQDMSFSPKMVDGATEKQLVPYLLECYKRGKRLRENSDLKEEIDDMMKIIIGNLATGLTQPDIYEGQNLSQQIITALSDSSCEYLGAYFRDLTNKILEEGADKPCECFFPVLNILKEKLKREGSLAVVPQHFWFIVRFFASNQNLGEVLLKHSMPNELKSGKEFENTLLGLFLSFSCIPKTDLGPFEFFDKPSSQPSSVHSAIEGQIWTAMNSLHASVYEIFYTLLKNNKDLVLAWFGKCLEKNIQRGKLWSSQMQVLSEPTSVSDGFMLNLASLLLQLAEPIMSSSDKLSKVDPKYGGVDSTNPVEAFKQGVHLVGVEKETCFIPKPESSHPVESKFGLSSDLFFLTHKTLDLSTRLAHEKLIQLSQELNKLQRAWQELQGMGATNSQQALEIQDRMNVKMSVYLSIRASIAEPKFSENCMKFLIGSAKWASKVGLGGDSKLDDLKIGSGSVGEDLVYVPEFVATNIADYVLFLRRFHAVILEDCGESLGSVFDFILVFMGSKGRMKNPHLRAKMAELCESLMPHIDENKPMTSSTFYREMLFKEYRHKDKLVGTLMNVFVSIEMTGEGVAFEQKFNYRRPMYTLMEYLWSIEGHKKQFKILANETERNLDAMDPPLFLRFLNLLMNDAVYLLDEALSHMAKIREQQSERNTGDWPNVPANQRQQREGMFQHMGMLARFHNHLGLATIKMLTMLTSEIKTIFYQPMLVDRIASMLNFFLLNLVGPKNRDFKAKDFEKYEFKPAEVVTLICRIYSHLGRNLKFCTAISADGRSYSPQLFEQAESVLTRLGKLDLVSELQEVALRVKTAAFQQQSDDEIAAQAPEEYLDPIMSTLMLEPVMLPSSRNVIDRSTIARHLLSDQSDPFNRAPLTLDQVIPCPDLKEAIHKWLEEKRSKKI